MLLFQEKYKKEAVPELMKRFGYKNVMALPKIKKIVVNIGIGHSRDDNFKETVKKQLSAIVGQKLSERAAKQSIAAFKIRTGSHVGYSVTLRGQRMYDFLNKFIQVAIPRRRDFRGLNPKSVDAAGNLTIAVKEHLIFPEMIGEDVRNIFSFEVTIVTSAKTKEEALGLFEALGFPFSKK